MPRRDQPYIPLYVMDFLTDEKLRECSAASVGVYIMLMCVMHKQEEYGTISLRQRDRHNEDDPLPDFASKLSKHLPFGEAVIEDGLRELISEGVLHMDGGKIIQRRMVRDADISQKRAAAGKKGSTATNSKFDAAKKAAKGAAKENEADEPPKKKRGRPKKPEQPKVEYGEFVHMTEEEHGKLVEKYGEKKTELAITVLDNYKGQSGRSYVSDYRAILNWAMNRAEEELARREGKGSGTYTVRGTSLGSPGDFKPSGGFQDGK